MSEDVPRGARPCARVLVVNASRRLLMLEARDRPEGPRWWVAPGGGLLAGESFERAAARELHEETGLELAIGPWVWTRRHIYEWEGERHDQYERYFVAGTDGAEIAPVQRDSYVTGYRWWSVEEIQGSREDFAPRRLPELIPPILSGAYPRHPIDCGV